MLEENLNTEIVDIMTNYEKLFIQRAYAITRNLEDARDIVQESFIKYIKFRKNGGEIKNCKNWFYMVIRNGGIDLLRKRNKKEHLASQEKHAELTLELTPSDKRSPDKELEYRENINLSQKILENLTEREASVIKMKFLHELSYKEIADKHEISVSNVGATLCNALKKLRKIVPLKENQL